MVKLGDQPIPLYWQGMIDADQTQRILLKNTAGLLVQSLIISVDDGDIQISQMNFVKQRPITQMDGTTNVTVRNYKTVQNQVVYDFYRGIRLQEDIMMTLFENGSADTEFSIMAIPARKGEFPFTAKSSEKPMASAMSPIDTDPGF